MKIIHLNTYAGNGGAGRACMRLNKALNKEEIDSEVWVNFSFKTDSQVHNLSSGLNKWLTALKIILERNIEKLFVKSIKIPFSFPIFGVGISSHKALKQADIIHLHWLNHAFMRPKDLVKLARLKKPIVWTFHDSNAFTGGCHVRYNCDHFHQECGNCPVLKTSNTNDWSHKIWMAKEKAYKKLSFNIIAPSNWMAKSVYQSKLLNSHIVNVIPNTLDTSIFKPQNKTEARKNLGLPTRKFIIMSGFMPSRKDLHKGTTYLVEAIAILTEQHRIQPEQMELVVFGNRDSKSIPEFSITTTFLGTIADDHKLALCYSAADAFIAPSLEDNLPNTVMESLACGTPVVAFTTGGIPDMVKHKENGYLAKYRSSADLAEGINWIYQNPHREELSLNAVQTVEKYFSETTIAQQHIKLYQSLLNNQHDQS